MILQTLSVFKLAEICDTLDYTELYKAYVRTYREYDPAMLFMLLVFAYMNGIYSSREIEKACRNDIRFMWILQNSPVPDHATIAHFQNERLSAVMENLFYQLVLKLSELGEAEFKNVFADGTKTDTDATFMALSMTFVLLLGCIDVSVASIMIVSCMVMGFVSRQGASDIITELCGILAGALCGALNGVLVAKFKMPSLIVTIATSMLFGGITEIIINGETLDTYPEWFAVLSWHDLDGVIPYSAICFIAVALILGFMLLKTRFGRTVYVIGNAETTAKYSSARIDLIKITVFTLMGVTAVMSGILFAGRLGGITSGMGKGYELQVIAIAMLGGVSTNGGKGKIFEPVIATFIMAFLNKTLDLIGVHANIQKIITGVILLIAVMIPALKNDVFKKKFGKGNRAK